MSPALTRVVNWGHDLLAEVVQQGDLVVDLTAGNGHDSLVMTRMVGDTGQVVVFDIQQNALTSTQERLASLSLPIRNHVASCGILPRKSGVDLVLGSHALFAEVVPESPVAIIANLGFLPGGDKQVITLPESTLTALRAACHALAVGGRIAVVVYPGHPGGDVEAEAVNGYFSQLNQDDFQVLLVKAQNRPQAPFLLVAEKKKGGPQE